MSYPVMNLVPMVVEESSRGERAFDNGHANGNAVGDLFQDDGLWPIGDARRDFEATNDRARMHDERVRCMSSKALARKLIGSLELI